MSNPKIKYIGIISPPFSSNNLLSIIQSQIPESLFYTNIFQLSIYYNNTNYNLVEPVIRFSINNKDISLSSLGTLILYLTAPFNACSNVPYHKKGLSG